MNIVALDGTKLLILMAAGGVFALAGLWLMFRPQPATETGDGAKIELFGLKFQASSAGLLVFLIGAIFLGVPIVVPEKPPVARGSPAGAGDAGPEQASSAQGDASPPPRARATGREAEPNEGYERANRLTLGDSVAGSMAAKDEDWFVVALPDGQSRIEVRIRSKAKGCFASYLAAYSPEEQQLLGDQDFGEVNTSKTWTIGTGGAAWVFLRLSSPYSTSCEYELFTSPAPD